MDLEHKSVKFELNGDKKEFEILFKANYNRLCAYACSFVAQTDLAEDIVTDVFLKLWTNRNELKITSSVSSYLFRSVKNSCINYLTRERNRKQSISENEVTLLDLKIKFPISDNSPLIDLIEQQLEEKIKVEIEKLPEQCRNIFQLSRYEELSHKEIAEKLGISENTVKVQIFRALSKLRKGLKHYLPTIIHLFPTFFNSL